MKVFITPKRDRAMIAFVNTRGIIYLPEGKKLPGIPKKKRIVVPLYPIEEIASRSPGLAQEIEKYAAIAVAASEAKEAYEKYRAYLIRKTFSTLSIPVAKGEGWEAELAQELINAGIPRVRVFTEGYETNVFTISAVRDRNLPESVREEGARVMFIKASPSVIITDFRRVAKGWSVYVPEKLPKEEISAVRCPLRFFRDFEMVYHEYKRLTGQRQEIYRVITQVYGDLGEMAVETDRGIFVMHNVSSTVVSAHYRPFSLRVLFVDPTKEKTEKKPEQQKQKQQHSQDDAEPNENK